MTPNAVFPWTILQKHACICHLIALFSSNAKADYKLKTKRATLFPDSLATGSSVAHSKSWQETKTTETNSSSLVRISKHRVEPRGFLCLKACHTYSQHPLTLRSSTFLTANLGVVWKLSDIVNFCHYVSLSYSSSGGSKQELRSWLDLPIPAQVLHIFRVSKALTGTFWSQFTQVRKIQNQLKCIALYLFLLGISLCALTWFYPFPLVSEISFLYPSPGFFPPKQPRHTGCLHHSWSASYNTWPWSTRWRTTARALEDT